MPSSAWRSTLFPYTTLFRSDRKSTRLNSSHSQISYAVFCLKKKNHQIKIKQTLSEVRILPLARRVTSQVTTSFSKSVGVNEVHLRVCPCVHLSRWTDTELTD